MKNIFDTHVWKEKIKDPFWYMDVPALFKKLSSLHDSDRASFEAYKLAMYDFFEIELEKGNIILGNSGKDFDNERKMIDTVVIHHTSMPSGITKERLSGIGLLRLYAPQYASPSYDADRAISKTAVWSGHFHEGKQVFWAYHWIVRTDGTYERLLSDTETGWQAGNWDVNCRSIGIVFDNDYEDSRPSDRELQAVADIVKKNYPQVTTKNIVGHCEVNTKTTCPSKLFLADAHGGGGWKQDLLNMLGVV